MTTGKTVTLTIRTFVGKVTSLLSNILSRLVIAFLPRNKHLLISWLQSSSAVILEPPKIVSHCFHCFSIYLPWSGGTGCHDLSVLNVEVLSFKPVFFTLVYQLPIGVVMSPPRLLCPWNSQGKNTGVGCLSLLQYVFMWFE